MNTSFIRRHPLHTHTTSSIAGRVAILNHNPEFQPQMRYSFALSTIIACTLGTKAYGFATRAAPSGSAPTLSYRAVDAASFTSTSINLFGFGKTVDAPTSTDITKKEVRALFELWNSALATGDSRIVASRYTKVRYVLSLIRNNG